MVVKTSSPEPLQVRVFSPARLRDAREFRGMTQDVAAEAAGVSRATLQNAESGKWAPRADTLARLAGLYGVSIDSLFVRAHEGEVPTGSPGAGSRSPDPD